MFKRITAAVLCLVLALGLSACSKSKPKDTSSAAKPSDNKVEKQTSYINNLTGIYEFTDQAKAKQRPVAIMINNVSVAQPVQTGVNKADIVYETEVEGGITRLLAVFKDISKVGQIGSVRSCRYVYIDLALGHNAVYCHHGQDPTYAAPHLKDVDRIVIDTANVYGKRISNGLALEHTLYGFGDKIWAGVEKNYKTTSDATPWVSFAKADEKVTLSGGDANAVTVPFSNRQTSKFVYDSEKKTYTRYSNGTLRADYVNGETTEVKNVFVLLTSITDYPDGYHRKVDLTSGTGYYVSNGQYTAINWKKGNSTDKFVFTNTDGSELKVNPGKSWVNIANQSKVTPIFE